MAACPGPDCPARKFSALPDNGLPHGNHFRLRETFLNHCYRKCGGQNWVVQRRRRSFDSRQSRVAKLGQLIRQTPRAVPQLQIDQPAQFLQASNGLQKKGIEYSILSVRIQPKDFRQTF